MDFLAALGDPPGVGGIDLSESSLTSITSKLSWLSVLEDFIVDPLELLDRGRGCGLGFGFCAGASDVLATCFFRICSRKSGTSAPLVPRLFVPGEVVVPLQSAVSSWRFGTTFRTFSAVL